ncbi:nitroreductase family protein [Kocuria sp. CPCC 205316]|uniref:nitroreductase family protein n=1 Tax=Kocuria TaxID=57493 RepID=UPI0036D846E0
MTQRRPNPLANFKTTKESIRAKAVPVANTLIEPLLAVREFSQDALRYLKYSTSRDGAVTRRSNSNSIEAQLTKDYHRIEKGLTLVEPKRPFGSRVEARIEALLPELQKRSPHSPALEHSETALKALKAWNDHARVDDAIAPAHNLSARPGENLSADMFFSSRHSVRNFDTSRPVGRDVIERAAGLAQTTPSVCNRQAGRLHVFTDRHDVQRILRHQNGNAGFAKTVPAVAVVTVDTRLFTGVHERHQRWVDGGLFAMTFVWALHALGVQSCMLNWSRNNRDSDRLRNEAAIGGNEDIVVLVAFGFGTSDHRIARSPKRALREILTLKTENSEETGIN